MKLVAMKRVPQLRRVALSDLRVGDYLVQSDEVIMGISDVVMGARMITVAHGVSTSKSVYRDAKANTQFLIQRWVPAAPPSGEVVADLLAMAARLRP